MAVVMMPTPPCYSGVAAVISKYKDELPGHYRLLFQPAEETLAAVPLSMYMPMRWTA